MKKPFIIIIGLVIAVISASVLIYHFLDINDYKTSIIAIVKRQTGQEIEINGDIKLKILPDIAIDINNVTINHENYSATIDQIVTNLRFLPLLKKQMEISGLKLVNPLFKYSPIKTENINSRENIRHFINSEIIDKLHLKSLNIENARVEINNNESNVNVTFSGVNLQTSLETGNNLLKIFGQIQASGTAITPFTVDGSYLLATDFYALSNLAIKLGNIETHGDVNFDFSNAMPDIKIAFYFINIDLNPYASLIDTIIEKNNLLNCNDKSKSPFSWSDRPIDFSMLRNFNGHFSFKSNNISYKNVTIGNVTVNSYLRNGKFTLSIKEAELLGGNINSEIMLDTTSDIAKIRQKINLEEIDLSQLPSCFSDINNITGRISGGFLLASRGISQQKIVNNVDGNISLRLDNGAISNIDIYGMLTNVNTAFVKNSGQSTIFSEISGDFDVRDGLVKSDNITLISDLFDLNGKANINLPELSIDAKLAPKIKKSKEDAGTNHSPLIIAGSLMQPTFRLEIQALVEDLIKNPKGTENLVKQLKRDFDDIKENMKNTEKPTNWGLGVW